MLVCEVARGATYWRDLSSSLLKRYNLTNNNVSRVTFTFYILCDPTAFRQRMYVTYVNVCECVCVCVCVWNLVSSTRLMTVLFNVRISSLLMLSSFFLLPGFFFFFFFFCCGTHFTFLSEGYVCRLTNVYWGPSGCRCPRVWALGMG